MKLLIIFLGALAVLFLAEKGYRNFWYRALTVKVQFQPMPAREGGTACLVETIENRKPLPLPVLMVEFLLDNSLGMEQEENASKSDKQYKRDVFSVSFYQKISRTITLDCRRRGYFRVDQANLTVHGIRMEGKDYRDIPQDTYLYVYPRTIPSDRLSLPMERLNGILEGKKGMVEDPFAFAGIRDYDATDPMNRINWKASARSGELMVNIRNSTYSPKVTCFLDVEDVTMWKHREIHEEGIRLAASMLEILLKKGIPAAFYSNGEDCVGKTVIQIPEGSGRGQLEKLNRSLSRLNLEAKERPRPIREYLKAKESKVKTGGQVILLITESRDPELVELVGRMAKEGVPFLWVGTFYRHEAPAELHMRNVSYQTWEVDYER